MITTAPLYTGKRVRTHNTNIGRILCTGKGCIGCAAKLSKHKNLRDVLGDVDTVEFDIRRGSALVSRPTTASGCYGNNQNEARVKSNGGVRREAQSNTVKKIRRIGQENRQHKSERLQRNRAVSFDVDSLPRETDEKFINGPLLPPSVSYQRKKNLRSSGQNGGDFIEGEARSNLKNTNIPEASVFSFTAVKPHALGLQDNGKKEWGRSSSQGPKRLKSTVGISPSKTNFLEMLQKSEAGIYDIKTMEERRTSPWAAKILESGACSEKELLPRIPSAKAAGVRATARSTRDACSRRGSSRMASNLPKIILNDRFLYQGDDAVVVIEHEREETTRKDETLHQLAFAVECSSVRRCIPRFSVLDIAEGLSELVKIEAVQFIQRKGKQWHVLVKGNCVRDFLMECGVVVKGRRLRMIQTAGR